MVRLELVCGRNDDTRRLLDLVLVQDPHIELFLEFARRVEACVDSDKSLAEMRANNSND